MEIDPDGALPLARRGLEDAVHAWADPVPVWCGSTYRWSDPLYRRLRDALHGSATRRFGAARRTSPCRLDALTLLCEIDGAVGTWEPHGKDTVDRLHALIGRPWRPQDCHRIDDMCNQLGFWASIAADLLGDATVTVALRLPCPSCNTRFVHRRTSTGEVVRAWTLQVSEDGCRCLTCRAFWPSSEFHWLARLLGCDALPA